MNEYGGNRFRGEDQIQPPWEIVTLTDYRRRHALYVEDAGLQKLRSTVSMIAQWDDHEFTNNPYGNGMGADNHQPECNGNRTNPGSKCSTDEGDFLERANHAAQAYFEWLPLRRGPRATQGQVDTDLTIVVEWGDVATFLLQDTRIEARPAHGTIGLQEPEFNLDLFSIYLSAAAGLGADVRTWQAEDFALAHAYAESLLNDPRYELLGAAQRQIMTDIFSASKAGGKVWQIYGSSVVVGDQLGSGSMYSLLEAYPDQAGVIGPYLDALYPSSGGQTLRGRTHASAATRPLQAGSSAACAAHSDFLRGSAVRWPAAPLLTPCLPGLNPDSWTGFKHERAMLYDILKQHTNNAVVLSGDVHDFWALQLHKDGETEPIGINIVAGGVTANGWGTSVGAAFGPFGQNAYNYFEEATKLADPYLKYAGIKDKGFWVIKANATHHVSEAIMINTDEFNPNPTNDALALTPIVEGVLAPYYCDVSLVSTAGQKGSLVEQAACEIEFMVPSSRRRASSAPTQAQIHPRASPCDCLFEDKLGMQCNCL
eukprot:scaffold30738_cov105-Isochrysis_galbana.AAC.7